MQILPIYWAGGGSTESLMAGTEVHVANLLPGSPGSPFWLRHWPPWTVVQEAVG